MEEKFLIFFVDKPEHLNDFGGERRRRIRDEEYQKIADELLESAANRNIQRGGLIPFGSTTPVVMKASNTMPSQGMLEVETEDGSMKSAVTVIKKAFPNAVIAMDTAWGSLALGIFLPNRPKFEPFYNVRHESDTAEAAAPK